MVKIGIDPGHGGNDPGAIAANGLQETEVNLAVALRLEKLLRNSGYSVFMSRNDDRAISLVERAAYFNREQVDLVISLHVNSADTATAEYICTFLLAPGGEAELIARSIQSQLVEITGWPDGGVRTANFYILRATKAPAVLVEMGFISNEDTASLLATESIQYSLAWAIYRGLGNYLDFTPIDYQGHWAQNAIQQALDSGFMSGYPDGTFRPDQAATRAELAAVLIKLWSQLKVNA